MGESISSRIIELAKGKNIRQKVIAETCGVPQSTLNTWLKSGTESIPSTYIMPMCRLFDCSPYVLLGDIEVEAARDGEQFVLTDDEARLIRMFRSLEWEGQAMVNATAIAEKRSQEEAKRKATSLPLAP